MSASVAAKAGLLAWRHRRALRRAAATLGIVAVALVLLPIAIAGLLLSLFASRPGAPRIGDTAGLPAAARPWIPLVNLAGETYSVNPYLLLAILGEETAFATHRDTYGVNFAGCCKGPFQMNVADGPPSTWDLVKDAYRAARRPAAYPHPATPHPSVYDSFDAAMAAANLLRKKAGDRLVALDDLAWRAARAYNGAGPVASAYADRVLAAARRWSARPQSLAQTWPQAGEAVLAWPVRGPVVSGFGGRWGRLHAGVDIAAPTGTPISAAAAGRVLQRGWFGGYGNFTCLAHEVALATCYAHQSRYAAGMVLGRPVLRGQIIGYVGCTGHCLGDHLHFEVHTSTSTTSETAVDPMPYLRERP